MGLAQGLMGSPHGLEGLGQLPHPGLHTLQALGAGNFEQFPRYRPEDFTRKVSCLGLVKLAKPASFQVLCLREEDCIT